MKEPKVAKITISIPQQLLEFADQLAQEHSTSRSEIIARLLKKEETARVQALMAEGYREVAEENLHLAQEILPLTSELLGRHTRWDEESGG